MKQHCDYPGCRQLATIRCGMLGCTHQVCSIHGNGGVEETPDHPPIEVCWGCDGKGWGGTPTALPGIHQFESRGSR
jgi:hypothetical protein